MNKTLLTALAVVDALLTTVIGVMLTEHGDATLVGFVVMALPLLPLGFIGGVLAVD